ncbi:hypothetical protein Tco_1096555 [Tanacetum coccineum]
MSFGDEPVYDYSYNQTLDISNPYSQPLTSSFNQIHCFYCKDPLEDGVRCQRCTCVRCGHYLEDGFCSFCNSEAGNLFVNDSNTNSFNDPSNVFTHPLQPQYETYSCELCGNDSHHGYDYPPRFPLIKDYHNEKIDIRFRRECENMIAELKGKFNGMSIEINKKKEIQHLEQESSIPLRDIISKLPLSVAIIPDLPTLEPKDSLIMGNEDLSTIPEKESDEFINYSVEDLVPIPSESEDTFESDSDCDLPSCDDFSPINVYKEKSVTFSYPLFDSNDDFTSSDDESLSDKDVPKDNNIESKESYVSNLDEPALLVTPLSDFNKDEYFDPGGDVDEIEFLLRRDPSTPKMSIVSIPEGFTDEPPLKENDDLFD